MRKYVIERDVPGIGQNDEKGLRDVARQSNEALAKLAPRVVWQQTYVTGVPILPAIGVRGEW